MTRVIKRCHFLAWKQRFYVAYRNRKHRDVSQTLDRQFLRNRLQEYNLHQFSLQKFHLSTESHCNEYWIYQDSSPQASSPGPPKIFLVQVRCKAELFLKIQRLDLLLNWKKTLGSGYATKIYLPCKSIALFLTHQGVNWLNKIMFLV